MLVLMVMMMMLLLSGGFVFHIFFLSVFLLLPFCLGVNVHPQERLWSRMKGW